MSEALKLAFENYNTAAEREIYRVEADPVSQFKEERLEILRLGIQVRSLYIAGEKNKADRALAKLNKLSMKVSPFQANISQGD